MSRVFPTYRTRRHGLISALLLFAPDTPLSIGLLVDHSSSMASKLPGIATAISGFAHASDPRDEMFVVDFGDDVTVQQPGRKPFTSNPADIERSILGVSGQGQTALYDAVAAGLDHLRLAHWQKRALIIVSDGGDNASWSKYSQILKRARQSRVVIYSIGLVDERGEEENPRILEELSQDTGGIAFFPRSGSAIMDSTRKSLATSEKNTCLDSFLKPRRTRTRPGRCVAARKTAPAHPSKLFHWLT